MAFYPIILDDEDDEPEVPPFQVTFKVKRDEFEKAKTEILTVLTNYRCLKPKYINSVFYQKRKYPFESASWIATSIVLFFANLFTLMLCTIDEYGGWNHQHTFDFWDFYFQNWIIFLIVFPILIGAIVSYLYVNFRPYEKLSWITVRHRSEFVYFEIRSYSKSWLAAFMDDLKSKLGDVKT